ncbi:type III-B CRISPR-associated protein Cas10/Cmr2 [Planktothrix mougeotii]|nr:type III-B CRISPR-associated protein Cas10/Cmr2 [Planktothrix mougeotii]
MTLFWQAKIWGLLHDPALKALYTNRGRGGEGAWRSLTCMQGWESPKAKSLTHSPYSTQWLKYIGLCDLIASASDRAAIGRVSIPIDYNQQGLEIRHLLSGKEQQFKLENWHNPLIALKDNRIEKLSTLETNIIPDFIRNCTDARQVYWWFWRCYPVALTKALNQELNITHEPSLSLLPADTRIPDASLWSHITMTSALAGGLAGYYSDIEDYPKKRARKNQDYFESRPCVGIFSFTPVQDLIKASRKMRDFWAGSWLLHYLSAKVSWAIAWKYGPDSLLYPCLYQQPLIDLWLLQKYPDFKDWITPPTERQLLTAGFPNVLVTILPNNGSNHPDYSGKNPVVSAMQYAEQTLNQEWMNLGKEVLNYLQNPAYPWIKDLNPQTWEGWLKSQWQSYWTALPIGSLDTKLHHSPHHQNYKTWEDEQNNFARPQKPLLVESEEKFIKASRKAALSEDLKNRRTNLQSYQARQPNLNVGSWWASVFDQTRFALNAVKNNRTWELPTAFGPRSTVSGIGPVVHSGQDWVTEGETDKIWQNQAGLFDGIEELNATEVLKRGLHKILPNLLSRSQQSLELYYPDLCSGVAGWLKNNPNFIEYYQHICEDISKRFPWTTQGKDSVANTPWGIPWVAKNHRNLLNPRLLNAGWLIEDFEPQSSNPNQVLTKQQKQQRKQAESIEIRQAISSYFTPGNNPTDWYILAAGDGDGMGSWLKGEPLGKYSEYIATDLEQNLHQLSPEMSDTFKHFLDQPKRMGPATHSALSRALLDFSNQLVPYLTEERYAGRLIYSGGDDVLAYTNLWEWDRWLWDIRQCFKGDKDPHEEFSNQGDYWHWNHNSEPPKNLSARPLFTMGSKATISFGIVIAHHSVPMAIALDNLWQAEDSAKDHCSADGKYKDAVQVRVIYGNGNILSATTKFDVFNQWRILVEQPDLDSAIFEQAAQIHSQHLIPVKGAIPAWSKAFCSRRKQFIDDESRSNFERHLIQFLENLWESSSVKTFPTEMNNWLKLAAFTLRNRNIDI